MRQVQQHVVQPGLFVHESVGQKEDRIQAVVEAEGGEEEERRLARVQSGDDSRQGRDAVGDVVEWTEHEETKEESLFSLHGEESRDVAQRHHDDKEDRKRQRDLSDHISPFAMNQPEINPPGRLRAARHTIAGTARRVARWTAVAALMFATVVFVVAGLGTATRRVEHPEARTTVDDITRLYRIPVAQVLTPTSTDEIVAALREHQGPVAIGGGRYSMGGQTATEGALQLDMRQFNRILAFSPGDRTITVQAGTRWRQIQQHIDSAGLSVKIMQTYSNFTVGGSLSVNVHGRYVGLGPVILSVRSLKVVLADGTVVDASPTQHADIFYGVVGGYGGLGVITEVTLDLAENVRVKRRDRTMPITAYGQFFRDSVRNSGSAVFHNGDIYPDDYSQVHAVTFDQTEEPVTVSDRLIPADKSYRLNRMVYWMLSEWPFGNAIREHVVDPLLYRGEPVFWRNYEASYDVAELEPSSRER